MKDGDALPGGGTFDDPDFMAVVAAITAAEFPLTDLVAENPDLSRRLKRLHPVRTAAAFAGLLTEPSLQANCFRIEALVHLALALGRGRQEPSENLVARAFLGLGKGVCGRMEDPPEDMFVTAVRCRAGNFLILEGLWEGSGFYLQTFLDILEVLPRAPVFDGLRAAVLSLLRLSDLTCKRAKLQRWQLGAEAPIVSLNRETVRALMLLRRHIKFRVDELAAFGIDFKALDPFIFDFADRKSLLTDSAGSTHLERRPIVRHKDDLWLMLPTAVSAAVRYFVIESMRAMNQMEALHQGLADTYARVFSLTPMLGGRLGAPVAFHSAEHAGFAEVMSQVDVGRYLHLLFFTDRLVDFETTGLVGVNPGGMALGEEFNARIGKAHRHASGQPGFRSGLTVIVGCGVGRGEAIAFGTEDHIGWRVESVSAYDFHTLSWTPDFDPLTLWRILDARDEINRIGTSLLNVNGLINLVGWVRSLNGHMVPHSQFPDGPSGGGDALTLMVDQASQRPLRHESAIALDPRVEQDITGHWLKLRRFEHSLFDDDRRRPVFATEDIGKSGRLMLAYLAPSRVWWADVRMNSSVSGPHVPLRT